MDQWRMRSPGDGDACLGYYPAQNPSPAGGSVVSTPEVSASGRKQKPGEPASQIIRRSLEGLAARDEPESLRPAELLRAELLGTVSHELRSPLTVIKGYAATLLRHEQSLDQAERREFLAAIGEACDRLEVTVNQLLEMSQLETGLLVPRFMQMDLERVVREAVTGVAGRMATSGVGEHRLTVQVMDTKALPLVQADPRLLRDALDSVLENALKYAPSGGAIDIVLQEAALCETGAGSARGTSPTSATLARVVVISVQDSGIGIPAERLERIFDSFHGVDTGLTREVNGLGLGLAIVARIVGLHGGVVWGESKLGEGSTFYLALPAAPEEDGDSQSGNRQT